MADPRFFNNLTLVKDGRKAFLPCLRTMLPKIALHTFSWRC
jgi:hypothetical protein